MKCSYVKSNDELCQANATTNSEYCFVHNPENQEKRLVAAAKGGAISKKPQLNLPPIEMRSPSDVVKILEEAINGVRSGTIPPQIANTLAYLCSHALRAMEVDKLDGRLEIVESVLLERKINKKGT